MSDSLQPDGLYSPGNSPGQNTGVGSIPLQWDPFSRRIPSPGDPSNPEIKLGFPHCRRILSLLLSLLWGIAEIIMHIYESSISGNDKLLSDQHSPEVNQKNWTILFTAGKRPQGSSGSPSGPRSRSLSQHFPELSQQKREKIKCFLPPAPLWTSGTAHCTVFISIKSLLSVILLQEKYVHSLFLDVMIIFSFFFLFKEFYSIWNLFTYTREYVHAQSLSHVQFFVTLWTVACQAPLSMGFSRQEYWNGLPFPPPWDLPHPDVMIVFIFYSLFVRSLFDLKSVYLYHRVLFSNKEAGKYHLFNA